MEGAELNGPQKQASPTDGTGAAGSSPAVPRRWQRFVDVAVASAPAETSGPAAGRPVRTGAGISGPIVPGARAGKSPVPGRYFEARLRPGHAAVAADSAVLPRTDLRLVPAALLVWVTAAAGQWLTVPGLGILCVVMTVTAGLLVRAASARTRGCLRGEPSARGQRSLLATLAAALILAAAAAAHAAVAASQRLEGPVAAAATARAAIVADLEIAGIPRRLTIPGNRGAAERWAVRTTLLVMRTDGLQFTASAALLVMGGPEWADVLPGQQLRVSGTLRPAEAGQPHAGVLAASSAAVVTVRPDDWLSGLGHVRQDFSDAADRLEGDARGLLPGMVTGDTSGLDGELDLAMKTVGMTHLTAVSGANCSLILGALLLAARTVRLPRPAAAGVCLSGLGLFVLLVGPDPSVLRAAMMGGIGLAALAFGRAGRGLSLLCVAVIGLVLADPALAASFGFVLSVLATFGIVVAGRRIMNWLPSRMPRWAAAGVAVPLSAQLLCGPVIVLLQPQFAAYALPANVAAAAFVVPVTLLGTAALPLLPLIPAAADMLMMVSGGFAAVVAGTARFFAILPGAALPWPEGIFGLCTMALLSAVALAVLWLALHPAGTVRLALSAHARTSALLESSFAGAWRGGRWRVRLAPAHQRSRGRGTPASRPRRPQAGNRGLVDRSRRGTLRVCKPTSGRNLQWRLPKPNAQGRWRRTPPRGET